MKLGIGKNTAVINEATLVAILNSHYGYNTDQVVTNVTMKDGVFHVVFNDKPAEIVSGVD